MNDPQRDIRLVTILPSSPIAPEAPLVLTMEYYSEMKMLGGRFPGSYALQYWEYNALSYTWGGCKRHGPGTSGWEGLPNDEKLVNWLEKTEEPQASRFEALRFQRVAIVDRCYLYRPEKCGGER